MECSVPNIEKMDIVIIDNIGQGTKINNVTNTTKRLKWNRAGHMFRSIKEKCGAKKFLNGIQKMEGEEVSWREDLEYKG